MTALLDRLRQHVTPFEFAGRRLMAPAQPLLVLALACQIGESLNSIRRARLLDLVHVVRADTAPRHVLATFGRQTPRGDFRALFLGAPPERTP